MNRMRKMHIVFNDSENGREITIKTVPRSFILSRLEITDEPNIPPLSIP